MITELDIKRAFRALGSIYNEPNDADAAMKVWRSVLKDTTPDELEYAYRKYMSEEHRFFPKPGRMKAYISERRRERGHIVQQGERWREGDGKPCPGCGASITLLEPSDQVVIDWMQGKDGVELKDRLKEAAEGALPRFGVLHDLDAHDRNKVPCHGSYGFRRPRS